MCTRRIFRVLRKCSAGGTIAASKWGVVALAVVLFAPSDLLAQRPPSTVSSPAGLVLPPSFDAAMRERVERAQLFTAIPMDLEWGLP